MAGGRLQEKVRTGSTEEGDPTSYLDGTPDYRSVDEFLSIGFTPAEERLRRVFHMESGLWTQHQEPDPVVHRVAAGEPESPEESQVRDEMKKLLANDQFKLCDKADAY